ncbi:hypothetical protein PHET_09441 [Paragonimus heterotremus]|uniref:Uncharacterized protein n=1 Tax=Paragonimus heterotremus TaxID=100268 RepID=A0A8J4T3T3_9TREM|nr:hypothetical protein PHET_09441 [Paragonimus heterotremus]
MDSIMISTRWFNVQDPLFSGGRITFEWAECLGEDSILFTLFASVNFMSRRWFSINSECATAWKRFAKVGC